MMWWEVNDEMYIPVRCLQLINQSINQSINFRWPKVTKHTARSAGDSQMMTSK